MSEYQLNADRASLVPKPSRSETNSSFPGERCQQGGTAGHVASDGSCGLDACIAPAFWTVGSSWTKHVAYSRENILYSNVLFVLRYRWSASGILALIDDTQIGEGPLDSGLTISFLNRILKVFNQCLISASIQTQHSGCRCPGCKLLEHSTHSDQGWGVFLCC